MSVAGQWDFTIKNGQLLMKLNTSGGNFEAREESFMQPSLHLSRATILLFESGNYKFALNFNAIGDIDGDTPTDIQNAYDLITTLIANFNLGGATPNLQQVTNEGKVTTNEIKAKWFEFYDVSNDAYSKLKVEGNVFTFYDYADNIIKMFQNDGVEITSQSGGINRLIKDIGLLTNDRNRTEPDKDGTYAMLDDIPTVPTTATDLDALKRDGSNANSDVDLGTQSLKATSVIIDTNGSTKYVEIKSDNVSAGGYTQQLQEKNATFAYMDDVQSAKDYADSLVIGLWNDRGNYDASSGVYPSSGGSGTAGAIKKGDTWTVSVAGTLPTGQVVEVGDVVRALTNVPGNTQANWAIQQNNIGYTAENSANKTDTMSGNTASSTKYLSAKGVYDWVIGLGYWVSVSATNLVSGIMKLYITTGSNTDGTMTQKAITDELALKSDKSLGAYKMRANNTNATANSTEQTFKAIDRQSYGGTITFTAGTAPSGALDATYSWMQIGNMATLTLSATYASAGSTVTQCVIPLPPDMPNPIKPTGRTSASEKLYSAVGAMMATSTGTTASAFNSYLRANSANTGFEFVITMSSGAYKIIDLTCTYPVS